MRSLQLATLLALIGSAILAAGLTAAGLYSLASGGMPWLFATAILGLGVVSGALVVGAFRRHRPSWAFLIAIWAVVGFCAFFAPPKVFDLPRIRPVTMSTVASVVEAENAKIKRKVMLVCLAAVVPFAVVCGGLIAGRRDYERTA